MTKDQLLMTKTQQVLVIHGGNAFETHAEYMQYLRGKEFSLEDLKSVFWKGKLKDDLGDGYDVYTPKMPNAQNARYAEWKIVFEKILALMDDDVILIGHSLGGIFLVKYLSENDSVRRIKALLLVGTPYNTQELHPLVDFTIEENFEKLKQQAGKISIYHSKDDKVVGYHNAEYYKKALPDAALKTFEDRGHFNQTSFPEIVEDIKNL